MSNSIMSWYRGLPRQGRSVKGVKLIFLRLHSRESKSVKSVELVSWSTDATGLVTQEDSVWGTQAGVSSPLKDPPTLHHRRRCTMRPI